MATVTASYITVATLLPLSTVAMKGHWPSSTFSLPHILLILLLTGCVVGQPDFAAPLNNVSVPVGRDATFSCMVTDLGGYRVGWVKADTKAIQAIHKHVITHNSRVSVSHSDHNTWMLHIRGVQEEDRGPYMCQINTDPMRSQIGYLEVTVPPQIDDNMSSKDVMVPEGSTKAIRCQARGYPMPKITWTREDGKPIVLRTNDPALPKIRKQSFEGEVLNLTQITRSDMGPYLCMANNSVPPMVSKRIMVQVHFRPVIHVPNQLIGVPVGTSATLECNLEASPKSIQYWTRENGDMLLSNEEFMVNETHTSYYMTKMTLTIKYFRHNHTGTYFCIAKNSLGETEGRITVNEIETPTEPPSFEAEITHIEGDLGRAGYTPRDFGNEIPHYDTRYRGDDYMSPTKDNNIITQIHHVTHKRPPNPRTPPIPGGHEKSRTHHSMGGSDSGIGRPTRTPPWNTFGAHSTSTAVAVDLTLLLLSCLQGSLFAY